MENRPIRPIDITVVSGSSVVITIPEVFLRNGKHYSLLFELTPPELVKFHDLITGSEVVSIKNGVCGESCVLMCSTGNIFYADRLHLGRCYRLRYGNNAPANTEGTAGGVKHFINLNTPHCARGYDPANNVIPTTEG